jgi:hypothetical protein
MSIMKTLAWLFAATALLFTADTRADDTKVDSKRDEPLKVVVEQLSKTWGIRLKSVKVKETSFMGFDTQITLTLEFTKDVDDAREMKATMIAAIPTRPPFDSPPDTPPRFIPPMVPDMFPLLFLLFDEDNVSIGRGAIQQIEGEPTGVKGDAFRAMVYCNAQTLKKAKKLEARLAVPPE